MTQLLQNALYGTALILAAAALRRALKDRLPPEARLVLWAACLFRLLTPAAPASALSLWSLPRLLTPRRQPAAPAPYVPAPGPAVPGPAPAPQPAAPGFPWEAALGLVWLATALALAAWYVLGWRRTRRAVASAIPLGRDDPRYRPLPSFARLREGPMEGAPLTFGAVRPTVVLSPGLSGEELECVLAHEAVHARRRDNLWHYAMALALVVHWWNPAVWLMSRLLRRDIELACDRAALKRLGTNRRADYAGALVTLATQGANPPFCQTFGRRAAEERILSVMKFKKTSVIGVIFSLALVLAVTVAFASEPKEPTPAPAAGYNSEDAATSSAPAAKLWTSSFYEDGTLKDFSISLEYLEQNLAEHVAGGSMTQEEADRVMEQARAFAQDGTVECSFGEGSGLMYGRDDRFPQAGIFFTGEDGNCYPADPAVIVGSFMFPEGGTVEYQGRTYRRADLSAETLEWLDWFLTLTEEEQLAVSYVPAELRPEETPEVSDAQSADASPFLSYPETPRDTFRAEYEAVLNRCVASGVRDQSDLDRLLSKLDDLMDQSDAGTISRLNFSKEANGELGYLLNSADTVRTSSGNYSLCTAEGCADYDHFHMDGKIVRVYQQSPGLLCAHPDCALEGPHQHDGLQYAGKAGAYTVLNPDLAPAPSTPPEPTPAPTPAPTAAPVSAPAAVPAGQYPVCAVEGCALTGRHVHDGVTYCGGAGHYGGFCDGSCGYCGAGGYAVCAVEGCALTGQHLHDGVTYCGGAGHHGGFCDGSCGYAAQSPAGTAGGHHSGGHHGGWHH